MKMFIIKLSLLDPGPDEFDHSEELKIYLQH